MADTSLFETWSPVTQDFGLVRGNQAEVADAYVALFAGTADLRRSNLEGGIAEGFGALAPLTHAKSRRLFLATRCGWTAFFQNGTQGSDPFLIMLRLAQRLGTTAMRVCCMPPGARWPGVIWEVYAPPPLGGNAYGYRRSIVASNDGGRWVFSESGERFAFEHPEYYALPRKRDRFTRSMLEDYLRAFGIPELGDGLFLVSPATPAILFHDPAREGTLPEYSLAEVKRGLPWQRGG